MAQMHEVDPRIFGDDMQFVEIELDPRKAAARGCSSPRCHSPPAVSSRLLKNSRAASATCGASSTQALTEMPL